METSAVPVTGDGLGGEGDLDAVLFRDAVEEETRDPELVANWMYRLVQDLNSS